MHRWTCMVWWALWVSVGILRNGEAAHRSHGDPFGGPRNNEVLKGPSGTLVEALRQLLGVPNGDLLGPTHHYAPPPRPPRYMLDLYKRISQEGSSLPRHANTVRSFKPRTDEEDMLLFNVSAVAREQVLGAWLHLRGSSGRSRAAPRLRPSRVLVYLFPEPPSRYSKPPAPIMMHKLNPHQQEIELTRAVKEVVKDSEISRPNWGLLGMRVEELRRGRYVSRSTEKLSRRPPLLFVYSSDPALLDLQALGAAALNVTKVTSHAQGHSRSAQLKRYTRDAAEALQVEEESDRTKRSMDFVDFVDGDDEIDDDDDEDEDEDEATEVEDAEDEEEDDDEEEGFGEEEEGEEEDREVRVGGPSYGDHSRHHPLLTNELPFLPKVLPPERKEESEAPSRRHRRRRRKHHRKRGKGEDDSSLIPLPENYSKVKWGETERRRKNKRRRRNRKLPDDWLAAAQNTLSNDANSVNFGAGLPGGGPMTSTRPCDRHKLQIDFRTLGWGHWIVAPRLFDAYYCAGVCPNPLSKQMSGSNHAIIQSMIYSMGLRPEVPAPCCVPEKLDGLTLLSTDAEGRFVLKTYSKMVVTSCSCQ